MSDESTTTFRVHKSDALTLLQLAGREPDEQDDEAESWTWEDMASEEAGVRNNLQTMNIPYLVKSQNEDLHDAVVFDGDKKFKADLNAYGQVVVPVDKGHGIWGVSRSCLEEAISFCQAREIVEASFKLSTPDGKRVPIQY